MNDSPIINRPVILLWDIENAGVFHGLSGIHVTNRLHTVFGHLGSMKSKLAFGDCRAYDITLTEQLTMGGVKIIDAARTNNRKDVADMMIQAEMILFAVDYPAPATIILISGDGGFCYALSSLKSRGYYIVIAVPKATSRAMVTIADEVYDWEQVLRPTEVTDSSSRTSSDLVDTITVSSAVQSSEAVPGPIRSLTATRDAIIDFLDVLLEFKDRGVTSVLASRAGQRFQIKYPGSYYKGIAKILIEDAVQKGWVKTEGTGGYFSLVFDASALDAAWVSLIHVPLQASSSSSEPAKKTS